MTIFLHESFVGNTFRQIFTDGRPLPKLSETEPAWLGYSVGRWEGDTFVVESIGFRDKGWLSANMAYPNSDALKVTERWRRIDFGHLEETVTIDDPKAYVKPWTNKIILTLQADTEILDSYCDNQMQIIKTWSYRIHRRSRRARGTVGIDDVRSAIVEKEQHHARSCAIRRRDSVWSWPSRPPWRRTSDRASLA